jgi:hypothetical protein
MPMRPLPFPPIRPRLWFAIETAVASQLERSQTGKS